MPYLWAKKSYGRIRADKTEDKRGVAGIRQAVGRKARDPARIPQQSTRPEEIARFSRKNHKDTRLTISILLKTVPTTRTYYVVGFFCGLPYLCIVNQTKHGD